jgi:transposase
MNLNISKRGQRIYLCIEKKYWDKQLRRSRTQNVKSLGFLDTLQKTYPDPVAHFRQVAKEMTLAEKTSETMTVTINMNDLLEPRSDRRYNLGYDILLKIFHDLELDRFLKNKARHEAFEFNTNAIMQLLVISRILSPGSKLRAFQEKERYFERFDFELTDVYRALSHFARISRELQQWMSEKAAAKYGRNTSVVYYDVTNFHFEIDKEDDLRKFGKSKEGRKDPIVQVGLAMDADGIPLHYEMFAGNTLDKQTFRRVIGEVRNNYDTGRIVAVADMGITTGDNIYYLKGGDRDTRRNGYVFSFSVRGGTEEFKGYVLDQKGYVTDEGKPASDDSQYKVKSRLMPRYINVTNEDGKKCHVLIDEKQVVFWSEKYAVKAKHERESVIKKAKDIIAQPSRYSKHSVYGAEKYVKGITYNKATGEIINEGEVLSFNEEQLEQDEKYDGYYSIVTSELEMTAQEIIETYRGLWEIEETFKIAKSTIEIRPVYLSIQERINAHILVCFISLVIIRLIQKKTGKRYSAQAISDELNRISCSQEEGNIYLFDYRSEVTDALSEAFGLDFTRKRLTLDSIKKVSAKAKSRVVS